MKVTISDIAKMTNVSKTTVSRVINNKPEGVSKETRDKILQLIDELNYQPSSIARSLVTKRTKTIGLIIPDIMNPFFPQVIRGAEDYANDNGYQMFLSNCDNNEEKEKKYITSFIEKGVDGVILSTSNSSDGSSELLKNNQVKYVLIDRRLDDLAGHISGVFVNNEKGAYIAAKLLIDHGNKHIAFINGSETLTTSQERYRGFHMAMKDAGLKIDKELIFEGGYTIGSGFEIAERLHNSGKRFDAILCANDIMAIGAMNALKKYHIRVPQDVEIMGYDNIQLSEMVDPALSTVAQPMYEMGYEASKLIIQLIEGKRQKKKNIILEPELVLRETTRAIDSK